MNIRIEHIQRKDGTSQLVKYPGCSTTLTPYMTRTGAIFTGLSDTQVTYFAGKLGMNEEWLKPPSYRESNSQTGKFWRTFAVSIPHDGMALNTDDAFDELTYTFLLSHHLVAKDEQHVTGHHKLVIVNEDVSAKSKNTKERKVRQCYRELDKMTVDEMRRALRVLGIRTVGLSNELAESKLTESIKDDPQLFITRWIDNKDKEVHEFIEHAIEERILSRNKNIYTFGSDTIAHSLEECKTFFKSPKNSDMYKTICQALEAKQKIK